MKTIITLLATTALVAGASGALASDFQASDEAAGYALRHQGWGGAYKRHAYTEVVRATNNSQRRERPLCRAPTTDCS